MSPRKMPLATTFYVISLVLGIEFEEKCVFLQWTRSYRHRESLNNNTRSVENKQRIKIANMKKALLIVTSLVWTTLSFAYDFEKDGVFYNIISVSDLTVEVAKGDNSANNYSGDVVVPEEVEYSGRKLKVIAVGKSAFYQSYQLSSVHLPNSITSIGEYAFYYCKNVTTINMPSSLKSIGDWAFGFCNKFEGIDLPENVDSIGIYAFCQCKKITHINIPRKMRTLAQCVFTNSGITEVDIPDNITYILKSATYRV